MGSLLRKIFTKCGKSWGTYRQSPRNQRPILRDAQHGNLGCASAECLSSYYSVFVARLAIMAMLAILIGLLTLLTWHFTKVYTNKSLETLAYGLRYELLQRPILRMWNIFNSTVEITTAQVKLSEFLIKKYSKPVNQAEQVELYQAMKDVTWALFASHKALKSITMNYKNGFVQAFHRDHRSNNTFYIYSDLVNYSISGAYDMDMLSAHRGWNDQSVHNNISAIWYREPLDPLTGEKTGKAMPIPPDDLINIAGISQVPDGVASWHVAVSKYSDSPLLSAALPVLDSSKQKSIVAVVGVTTALYSVGQLMKELVEFHTGHIYLTSREGWLLSTSTDTPLLMNSTTGPKLMMAVDSEDVVIRSGAKLLQKNYGTETPTNHTVHIKDAKLGNQLYYIDSFILNLKRLPMVGVIIIPRKYIMGKVDRRAMKTLVILISASFSVLVTGCVFIFILTNGVSKEMKLRAELISQLDARRKAEASSNYKSQFLANMSHELRTPMAAVIGLLDILMSDDCLTNEQYSTIAQIRRCSTALLRLLNNILDLSKVESGKLVLEVVEFNLEQELEGLVDMFSVQCINHKVEIFLDLSDNVPKLIQGDSGRVVQIFANLISNSIKFTTSGYIVLRGWCENTSTSSNPRQASFAQTNSVLPKTTHDENLCEKDNQLILCFEVEDTGCGIDPSKWESVFESFEQADPSTTRLHGGTGLGLCIVRTLVNQMGGEIKFVNKNGPGSLMQLYLLLRDPIDGTTEHRILNYSEQNLTVLLALGGRMGSFIMSSWLQQHGGMYTYEACDWNELTAILQELFQDGSYLQNLPNNSSIDEKHNTANKRTAIFIILIDIILLDLSTDIWKEQLNFLDRYRGRAQFAWILNHDTSSNIKKELYKKGHLLMIHKCLEMGPIQSNGKLENKYNTSDAFVEHFNENFSSQNEALINCFVELTAVHSDGNDQTGAANDIRCATSSKTTDKQTSLEGLRILLAEDTPVLQRVATIMLEKLGAKVVAVGDGLQVVNALHFHPKPEKYEDESFQADDKPSSQTEESDFSMFDLILMDCQMPKMDGYEATKAIRRSEIGTTLHIPIVALTAHAMSSDEAKCIEVGMDAYLTKPIDRKLMVSTILSLTKRAPEFKLQAM
ncbi:Proteasome A-type subunit [Heracleum sosnowskyi]|uniref:histidine kinase n=1 Tax=Heracleum sosnowskyi TaxID=360622 RepID=A0AAD8MP93_9APIA|nr:Proteasome A-type subunit [Heracleum sosnowskyi]